MRKSIITLLLLLAGATVVRAQNVLPAIITFTSSQAAITVNAAERGQTGFELAWHVINMDANQQLILQRRSLGQWETMTDETELLSAIGTRTQTMLHPLDFGPPTYRLLLVDDRGQTIDERIVTIPYEIAAGLLPEINLFASRTPAVASEALADGSARASVSWQVINRLPTSNLVFEQVLEDGQSVPVELPRTNLWVASQGDGVVAPVAPPLSADRVRLRLRVIDVVSGEIYAEAETEVGIGDNVIIAAPTHTPAPRITPAVDNGTPQPTPTPRNCVMSPLDVPLTGKPDDGCDVFRQPRTGAETRIVSFAADMMTAAPGRPVTLRWEIQGAQFALLEVFDPAQLQQGSLPEPSQVYYDGLPVTGSLTITLPASMTSGARLILWAANLSTEARSPSFLYDRLAYRIIDLNASSDIILGPAKIMAFVVLPPTVGPGGEVTLSWNLQGADTALLELYNLETDALAGVFEDLPTIGSANIVIPDEFRQGAHFVLWAANHNADGSYTRLARSELDVPAG